MRPGNQFRRSTGLVIIVIAVLGVASPALANGPEGGLGPGTSITVVPSDNLPGDAVVGVVGEGFPPGADVTIGQCTRPSEPLWHCRTEIAKARADAAGRFPLTTLRVSDFVNGDLCQARNDCFVAAVGHAGDFPHFDVRKARHHLTFAPRPFDLLDRILGLLGVDLPL